MNPWLRSSKDEREDGFTLIELLVVVLIIGILAAIAIPAFLNQRKSAVDASVQSDLHIAGSLMLIESLDGKTLTRTVSINEDGLNEEGMVGFALAGTGNEFDFSSIRVSEGNTLIFQPSMADGGVCIFGVNPAGDVAAKSPGYAFDSNEGGILGRGARPGACASESGELNVPVPQIEHALDPDKPVASEPAPVIPEPPVPTPTPTPEPAVPVTQHLTDKLADRDKKCLAGNLSVSLSYSPADHTLSWSVTGLSTLKLDEGVVYLYEMDKNGVYVRTHLIEITREIIKSGKYTGSMKIGKMAAGNRFMLADDDNTVFYSGYREYYLGDKDWSYKTISKTCP